MAKQRNTGKLKGTMPTGKHLAKQSTILAGNRYEPLETDSEVEEIPGTPQLGEGAAQSQNLESEGMELPSTSQTEGIQVKRRLSVVGQTETDSKREKGTNSKI
nr:PREDICTED: uncharacterized protein LOC106706106 [Latimeria chalumnae]|eukprot:XP_014352014.1 PREDICTED: uncharacterized protein LOC106706106 [Latimeria chalumnae]